MAKDAVTKKREPMKAGHRYGRLVSVEFSHRNKKNSFWKFKCDCGNETITNIHKARSGCAESCGCARNERAAERLRAQNTKHGMTRTTEYNIWRNMLTRCCDPKHHKYHNYGGRGIKVCAEWQKDFLSFYHYIGPRPSFKYTLDRYPDPNGNYEPGNCRWATWQQQSRNKISNRIVFFQGQEMCLVDAAELLGIKYSALRARLDRGWALDRAFSQKVHVRK